MEGKYLEDFNEINRLEGKIYKVSELNFELKKLLEGNYPDIWVEGEISNFHHHSSGHMYFDLKDENSKIKSVMFLGDNRNLKFMPEDGMKVLTRGGVTLYLRKGEYQIVVRYIEPKGKGALLIAFEQLKKKLKAEGLFDIKYKKPIPFLPSRIGVVTSLGSAVLHDIKNVLNRRFENHHLIISPSSVEGESASTEICRAIENLNQYGKVDVIILARGGGSLEALWAFNTEEVARAVFSSEIPIISAVGHETDFTISDFVADLRAPTPSAAAEMVMPEKSELLNQIYSYITRLKTSLPRVTTNLKNQANYLYGDLQKAISVIINERKSSFKNLSEKLNTLSPLAILSRGYSVCYMVPEKTIVRSSDDVKIGQQVDILLFKGDIVCKVLEKDAYEKVTDICK
ncbi:MAG: exodeoxyribonuclease VII large subunit [Actinobacteria bacterium]|nr:exodeoxyribonuclease VII large subunit [Actinomycetota bacterium]